jgi:hypothetical protein
VRAPPELLRRGAVQRETLLKWGEFHFPTSRTTSDAPDIGMSIEINLYERLKHSPQYNCMSTRSSLKLKYK